MKKGRDNGPAQPKIINHDYRVPGTTLHRPTGMESALRRTTAPSLSAMVWIALTMGLLVARLLVESALSDRAQKPVAWGDCPSCGHRLQSKGWPPRQIETVVGSIIH
jgi:hypothetical protein